MLAFFTKNLFCFVPGLKFQTRNITKRIADNKNCLITLLAFVFVAALIVAATILYFCSSNEDDEVIDHPCGYFGDYLGFHRIRYKEQWCGLSPVNHTNLRDPVKVAIITDTFTPMCTSSESCSKLLKSIIQSRIDRLFSHTGYNFFIGGDGDIYVDIGWTASSELLRINYAINFIGNFNKDELNDDMIEAAMLLLEKGLVLGKLDRDYIVVGHNQTSRRNPDRPGENIMKVIKNWPHYSKLIL